MPCAATRLSALPIIDTRLTRLRALPTINTRLSAYASLASSIGALRAFTLQLRDKVCFVCTLQ